MTLALIDVVHAVYSRRYLLPDAVVTTCPALAPIRTGDVVIFVPVLNPVVLLTIPVSEPSLFCLNFDSTGMLSVLAPPPKKEFPAAFFGSAFVRAIVPERRAGVDFLVTTAGAFFVLGLAGGLGELPKNEKAGLGAGAGGGATLGAGAGLALPKKEKGCGAGAGGGTTLGAAGTGLGLPKKEKGCGAASVFVFGATGAALGGTGVDFFVLPGLGTGAETTFGAGDEAGLPKNENKGVGALFVTDCGTGFGVILATGLGAIFVKGAGAGVGAGFGDAFGARLPKKLRPVSFGVDFGNAFGAGADTCRAGLGVTFASAFGEPKKLNVGPGATFLTGSGALKTVGRLISSCTPADFFSGTLGEGFGAKAWKKFATLGLGLGMGAGALRTLNFSCFSSHSRACSRACSAAASSNCLRFAT